MELAALPEQGTGAGGTTVVGDGAGHVDRRRGWSRVRSAGTASFVGSFAVESYCPTQCPSRRGEGQGNWEHSQASIQAPPTGPELLQSRLQAPDASLLAIAREALLLPARRALAASACSACGRRLLWLRF